jgi:hypothetical protein
MRPLALLTRFTVLSTVAAVVLLAPTVTTPGGRPHPVVPEVVKVALTLGSGTSASAAVLSAPAAGEDQPDVHQPEVTTSSKRFSMVGATLPTDGSVTADDVQVRTRGTDGTWSPWTTLEAEDSAPDPGTAEARHANPTATEPVWAGTADAVQVRATPGRTVQGDVSLTLVDPKTSTADGATVPAGTAHAAETTAPVMITRAQWGADESLRTRYAGCDTPSYSDTIQAGVLHHTVNSNNYSSVAEAEQMIRADYAYHVLGNGWCDIGYNFLVDKFGNIYEGRAGGIDKPVLGAHAGGFNTNTFGVAMIGDFSTVAPSAAMTSAASEVFAYKLGRYDLNPTGMTILTSSGGGTSRYEAGTAVYLPVVMGHRDVGATACPGNAGYATLNSLRALTAAKVATRTGTPEFVRALYKDMMDRSPVQSEVDYWARTVDARLDRGVAVQGFDTSVEYRSLRIAAYYEDILGREVEPGGLASWLAALASGQITLDYLPRLLMLSPEFYRQGGGTDAGYVALLYSRGLERSATSADVAYWQAVLRAQGAPVLIHSIYDSQEGAMIRVARSYRTWLKRDASAPDRAYWVPVVQAGGDTGMRNALLLSPEYLQKAMERF